MAITPVHIILVFFCAPLVSSPAVAEINFYMSSDGADANAGTSVQKPIASLTRAKQLVGDALAHERGEKIFVHIAGGTYVAQSIIWDLDAGTSIVQFVGPKSGKQAIFDGKGASGNFFTVTAPSSAERFNANVKLSNVVISDYCEGVSFGDYRSKAPIYGSELNRVEFTRIGSKYDASVGRKRGNCVAAVRVQWAPGTILKNLKFSNIENLPQNQTELKKYGPLALHAIYIADRSSNIHIENSSFRSFTGSPIRIRNRSDHIKIVGVSFSDPLQVKNKPNSPAYNFAAVSQWNCTTGNQACLSKPDECPSVGISIEQLSPGDGMLPYLDETPTRGMPTCKDTALLKRYKLRGAEFSVLTK